MCGRYRLTLLIICLLALCSAAYAEKPDDGESPVYFLRVDTSKETVDWRDFGLSKETRLPVYSAPFDEAYRPANGKAAVALGEPFLVLGAARNGTWLWISYDIGADQSRIGWVHASLVKNKHPDCFPVDGMLVRINRETPVTDDPMRSGRILRTLKPGETVIGLCSLLWYDQECLYIETEMDGQTVWGFIPGDTAMDQVPLASLEGDTLRIHEGVTTIGDGDLSYFRDAEGRWSALKDELYPVRVSLRNIDLWDEYGGLVKSISFPSTLRSIAASAISTGSLETLSLPEGLNACSEDAFYDLSVETLSISQIYTGMIPGGQYFSLKAFQVAEGNPAYRSVDGVLFSADGKILLRYPNGRPDLHYDVPAGVEVISPRAFSDDDMSIPLQTISLPMGLKSIGAHAFDGCGRLLSLTVPLTVTEIGEGAFASCVSLERLSLPPELDADIRPQRGVAFGDFTHYNGDNGSTAASGTAIPDDICCFLIAPEAQSQVPAYASADDKEPFRSFQNGSFVRIERILAASRGRLLLQFYDPADDSDCIVWLSSSSLLYEAKDTLFHISDMTFPPNVYQCESGLPADPARIIWYDESEKGEICFELLNRDFQLSDVEWESETLFVPVQEVIYFRDGPDDGRTLGLVMPPKGANIVYLSDAPDGSPVGPSAIMDQADLLDSRDGWVFLRTVRGQGWLPEANFKPVFPKDAE